MFPGEFPWQASTPDAPWPARYLWSLGHSVTDAFNLSVAPEQWSRTWTLVLLLLFAAATLRLLVVRDARARLRPGAGIVVWGLTWFALMPAFSAELYPSWAPYRSVVSVIGLGIPAAAYLGAAHPSLLALFFVARVGTLVTAYGPPSSVPLSPQETGVAFDFPKLARVQRFVRETRTVLTRAYPSLPKGASVVPYYLPRMAAYAFAGSRALQVWYGDTTLHILDMSEFRAHPREPIAAVIEYEREGEPQAVLVNPDAMRHLLSAAALMGKLDWRAAIHELEQAETGQQDRNARGFFATVQGKRGACLLGLGDQDAAWRQAQLGLATWRGNADSRRVLAALLAQKGHFEEAIAQLDTQLVNFPQDDPARELRARLRDARSR
jgi:hypothetical protein